MSAPPHHKAYVFKKNIFNYLLVGMLLLALFFFSSAWWSYQQQNEVRHSNWEESVERAFNQRMSDVSTNIEAILYVLGKNPLLKQQFLAGDRVALLETAQDLEFHFEQNQQITHFYFHDLNKKNFLRVHRPERYGDTINRITMQQAVDSGKMAAGLELGPLGTLTLRHVMPWYSGDRLIGYLELGRELPTMITVLKQLNLVDGCLLTVRKKYIDRDGWQQGMAMMQRQADWSVLDDRVVVTNQLPAGFDITDNNYNFAQGAFDLFNFVNTENYMRLYLPLLDASNRQVGQLLAVRDTSAQLRIARQQLLFFLLPLVVLTVVLLTIFYRILSKVEENLMLLGRELEQRVEDRTMALQDEVSQHRQTSRELELQRQHQKALVLSRTRLLDAVAYSARSFLKQGDWQKQLPTVLERLGKAVDASRVTLYQNSWTENGELLVSLREVWQIKDLSGQPDNSQLQNMHIHKTGFERWQKIMIKGAPIHGLVATFPESEQKFFQNLGVQSLLAEPIFVDKEWWGFLNFSDCVEPRQWSTAEVDGLYTVAEALGATIQQQQHEEIMRAARHAAEAANRAKSDFLANMSHEIRTPMNAIAGFVDLSLREKIPAKVRRNLDIVKKSSKNLLGIINDILDFSKIESQKIIIETIDFNLFDITSNLEDMLHEKAAARGNQLVFNIDKNVPEALTGDPLRLGQILVNLLANAIKFTRDGTIAVEINCLDRETNTATLQFSVHDSGVGIAAEKLDDIFKNFTQADGSITREFGGTGLGLTISRKLVELMGGELEVTSRTGEGSTFSFSLPLGVQGILEQLRQENRFTGKKILVVDDNTALLTILRMMLQRMGFEVATAELPGIAMLKLRNAAQQKSAFDLVLMDFMMPEQDGISTAKEIRNDSLLADTPIVMLTAYGAGLEQQRAQEAMINAFLKKPVTEEVLFKTIQTTLQEEQGSHDVKGGQEAADVELSNDFKVLLVEDNQFNQILAKEVLKNAGLHVETANNGKEALSVLLNQNTSFHAILMDVQMPVLDGLAATSLIRRCETGNLPATGEHQELLTKLSAKIYGTHIYIVALTANAMTNDKDNCLKAGMDDYIAKPFMQKDVLLALQRAASA